MAKYTPMIQQYLEIKAQVPDAFLFFRLGDFYEMFFDDAKLAAQELEITLTSREGGGNDRIPMCGVPYHSAESYVQRLIERGYKVAICEQVENPATAKGVVKREIVRIITPGTVMDEQMLEESENNFLVALFTQPNRAAVASVDLSTGELHVTETQFDIATLIDEIESFHPKEVVIYDTLEAKHPVIEALRTHVGCLITPVSYIDIDHQLLATQFPRYQEICNTRPLQEVLQLLYGYLQQTQKRFLNHLGRLSRYDRRQHMVIDESAKRNLELQRTLHEGKKKGSLLWLLDRTSTAMGSRMLKRWLERPLLSLEKIQTRLSIVAAFVDDIIFLDEITSSLKEIYDLERLAARVAYGSATARDLAAISRSLERIPKLKQMLLDHPASMVQQLGHMIDPCEEIYKLITNAIVDDPPLSVKEGDIIQQGYHAELDQLRNIQKNGKDWIAQLQQQERELTGIKSLKVGYNRVFGYYIEVTKSNLRHLPEGRYIRKQTLANAERFITPELKEQEQMILNASERSVEMEYEIFTSIRDEIGQQVHQLQHLAERMAALDCFQSLATVAHQQHYVCPTVTEGNDMLIQTGRHPVVEAVVDQYEFVANDIELNPHDRQILLITGPNMAGKSTYMRQVALINIMAQIGSFVPAEKATLSIVDRIFTRIGAADDLVGGRSTFMVEMAETCRALKEATPRSLILLDEVGRGTSTYDGMALAHAIVEYIHDHVRAKTLFSTHYHELTALEETLPRLFNIHAECAEQDGKVVFLHRMLPGGADQSYGIHVAELAGLPAPVVKRAKLLLQELEGQTEVAATTSADVSLPDQISLFQTKLFEQEQVREAPISSVEREVLEQIERWEVMNQTPLETMQQVVKWKQILQKRLTTK
ncbi:DNA mismatch repair protein MutS [Seinonella peptonophila]|uniref:DNA mismatch repair protein MutS n=1 Tax=Seinonella peptonophila TaxID=112248 RepID=A0A1M4T2M8_9BACL|nr:DNA mismatch repair protein MutS [Seinonella peptonophila]SHE38547.1 DNA mismatch repair protein MutS [Seinonella peptonophila]